MEERVKKRPDLLASGQRLPWNNAVFFDTQSYKMTGG